MKSRLKEIRKYKDMNQADFASDLGISVSNIQSYETGRRVPSDAFIKLICNKFGINEDWLRTGEGEMLKQREDEIARITDQMLSETEPSIRNALHRIVADASEDDLKLFLEYARKLVAEMDKENPPN